MLKNKLIALMLTTTLATSISFVGFNEERAYASTNMGQAEESHSSNNFDNIIKEIENTYLFQKSDGTFSINSTAYDYYDKDVLDFIKNGMNDINDLILNNELEFKMINTRNTQTVVNIKSDIKPSMLRSASAGRILSSYSYCSNYKWHWWGYTTNVNKSGTEYLLNYLEGEMFVFGSIVTAIGFIPGGVPAAAIAGIGGAMSYGTMVPQLKNGISSGKGITATGYGKPSSGYLLKAKARY